MALREIPCGPWSKRLEELEDKVMMNMRVRWMLALFLVSIFGIAVLNSYPNLKPGEKYMDIGYCLMPLNERGHGDYYLSMNQKCKMQGGKFIAIEDKIPCKGKGCST